MTKVQKIGNHYKIDEYAIVDGINKHLFTMDGINLLDLAVYLESCRIGYEVVQDLVRKLHRNELLCIEIGENIEDFSKNIEENTINQQNVGTTIH